MRPNFAADYFTVIVAASFAPANTHKLYHIYPICPRQTERCEYKTIMHAQLQFLTTEDHSFKVYSR